MTHPRKNVLGSSRDVDFTISGMNSVEAHEKAHGRLSVGLLLYHSLLTYHQSLSLLILINPGGFHFHDWLDEVGAGDGRSEADVAGRNAFHHNPVNGVRT